MTKQLRRRHIKIMLWVMDKHHQETYLCHILARKLRFI